MDNLAINAALWNLVRKQDMPDSAQQVVDFALKIPLAGVAISITNKKRGDGGFKGMTEIGEVAFREDGPPETETTEFGITRVRVGHFKVWRHEEYIEFCHYFGADVTTEDSSGEGAETFLIMYSAKEARATAFGVWRARLVFSFWIVRKYRLFAETFWGQPITQTGVRLAIG